jgi:uncharacterized protein (TIGR02145 family)
VWYLIDTREAASTVTEAKARTYKVKKMADGRIWMVQDLKFGDKCSKLTISFTSSNQIGNITSLTDKTYYGDCTNVKISSTPPARGYLYNWAAAINKADAYPNSSSNVGCSGTMTGTAGTAPGACQGICPAGWHVPTKQEADDAHSKFSASYGCSNDACWLTAATWEGVRSGHFDGNMVMSATDAAHYWTSTYGTSVYGTSMETWSTAFVTQAYYYKWDAMTVRCIRNY